MLNQDPTQPPLSRRTLLSRTAAAGPLAWLVSACTRRTSSMSTPSTMPATAAPSASDAAISSAPNIAAASATAADGVSDPTAEAAAAALTLPPTPACGDDDDDPTPAQTEGPFYTPDTPERSTLREPGMSGALLVVTGRVLDTDCRPVAGALLDFWHCDDAGVYDNAGYRLRGHQFADADGRWRLETILPATYPGRTRHIHVRVQPPGGTILTTQLYFPGEPDNARDGIYVPELELAMGPAGADGEQTGTFDFVVRAS